MKFFRAQLEENEDDVLDKVFDNKKQEIFSKIYVSWCCFESNSSKKTLMERSCKLASRRRNFTSSALTTKTSASMRRPMQYFAMEKGRMRISG